MRSKTDLEISKLLENNTLTSRLNTKKLNLKNKDLKATVLLELVKIEPKLTD